MKPLEQEERQHRQEDHHEPALQSARLLGSDHVDPHENERQGNGQRLYRHFDEERRIRSDPDERKGRLERERQVGPQPPDGPEHGAQATIQKVVRASGSGQCRTQLGLAEHGRKDQHTRNEIGEDHRSARLGRRQTGEQEEARTEHGPGTDGVDVEEAQFLFQPTRFFQNRHANSHSNG